MSRQIVLDTETTGLEISQGHRIIEIGCIEVINRRVTNNHWHHYINPDRKVDHGAFEIHGISDEFLADKPRFHELVDSFLEYIEGAELIIHNAPFDVGFLNNEIALLDEPKPAIGDICSVLDTLVMARQKHPGQKNNLDVLCRRYDIDNSKRTLHGALLDSEILAEVYLLMTGGQTALTLEAEDVSQDGGDQGIALADIKMKDLMVWSVDEPDQEKHREYLNMLQEKAGKCAW
ncbi:MAG: DNA polymerase III subunit epsilon [Gammaproteobacteria bacterium]|jgi:DNA polymerase-3 subunit epsilon|nr:DNA polymerase III subunit epsilon [Gammaproteobacteria bacterium]MBT3724249.1 DNA polymerase III subunit epsilon [Gammaproteobacteria bacterium]MBT4193697.1 DNA polymerase III subunit epsilon [Gammaproteobacteria bacterium]MBT4448378.1 DNA polymerase III subunit epsilon [Gammaproteobacteria bacterium]MBT4859367.1 DNA polymerase III subunit epsilon [Gammaproteobacteria bacterium]